MSIARSPATVRGAIIRLGDDEWGQPLMDRVARDKFAERDDIDLIRVHEHAGWFVEYGRTPDGGMCVLETASGVSRSPAACEWIAERRGLRLDLVLNQQRG